MISVSRIRLDLIYLLHENFDLFLCQTHIHVKYMQMGNTCESIITHTNPPDVLKLLKN